MGAHELPVNRLHVLDQIMAHRVLDPADGASVAHKLAPLSRAVGAATLPQVDAVGLLDVVEERLAQRPFRPADLAFVRILQLMTLHVELELGLVGRHDPANLTHETHAFRQ